MRARPAALIFILLTALIDIVGIGIIIPVLPGLVKSLAGSEVAGARTIGVLTAMYAVMQFICAPILGALSDRFGRRPVLLFALTGMGLDYLLLAFAPNLAWLFVGRVVAGITGASLTVANAYIADVSPPEERAKNFGLLGAMFGVGFILGPALGGLLGEYGLRVPFMVAAALTGLNVLYGLFVLPESLPASARGQALRRGDLNPLLPLRALGEYPILRSLALTFVLLGLAGQVIFSTWVLFTEGALRWTPAQNGVALAFFGLLTAGVQAGLIGPFLARFGERRTIMTGLVSSTLEFLVLSVARSGVLLYASLVVGALGGLANPAIQGLISKQVDETEQGRVQGAVTSLNSLVAVVGPILATNVYALGVGQGFPGAAFLMGALLSVAGTVLILGVLRRMPGTGPAQSVQGR
ncbi:DHA1 family tetracycline resistance protein-like MFS transporter [Deinococcus metalli]|uniref:DHA1 family tetracycline resistance protein-like MFS transporter n=1 Tax=Deinococcus metalli TaxID=1141878 RepID=A0A7W8KJC4_9DEIO|nr:TCR/Tet family MFS transporter [Deinococcus metalli]MBB5379256.1 DHA1 family tetracycline resistance protein-like MFS transporter [Deinococcus metalli]GHF65759.1 tetracycline resistance MFS efflux pump [Deinococcus metalli]